MKPFFYFLFRTISQIPPPSGLPVKRPVPLDHLLGPADVVHAHQPVAGSRGGAGGSAGTTQVDVGGQFLRRGKVGSKNYCAKKLVRCTTNSGHQNFVGLLCKSSSLHVKHHVRPSVFSMFLKTGLWLQGEQKWGECR